MDEIERLKKQIQQLEQQVDKLNNQLDWYEQQVKLLTKKQFGKSTEKMNVEQLSLFNEIENDETPIKIEPQLEEITYKRKKQKGKRKIDLSKFLTERIVYDVESTTCLCCSNELREVSENIRQELVYIPATCKVIEHIQKVYACDKCKKDETKFIKADVPSALITKSVLSPSLATTIVYNKFVLANPLYRQEYDFKNKGLKLSRQTMSNWLTKLFDLYLNDIQSIFHNELMSMEYLGADETTVQVINEKGLAPSTKSYMWVYKSGRSEHKQIVWFVYEPNRGHSCASKHLKDFKGILQADGYQAYDKVDDVTLIGCLAHARRKFIEVLDVLKEPSDAKGSHTENIVTLMNTLFHLEKKTAHLSYEEITKYRLKHCKPIFDDLSKIIHSINETHITNKKLKDAVTYFINQEDKLNKYLDDGRLEISNNSLERAIRPFTIGRKNWMFSNTPKGATTSSCYYSIIETAKLNHLNVEKYVHYLFTHVKDIDFIKLSDQGHEYKQLMKLMPWSYHLPENLYLRD